MCAGGCCAGGSSSASDGRLAAGQRAGAGCFQLGSGSGALAGGAGLAVRLDAGGTLGGLVDGGAGAGALDGAGGLATSFGRRGAMPDLIGALGLVMGCRVSGWGKARNRF